MNNTPTVSIGLPVYNGEECLQRVIASLLSQTFADFELIISDNASTDKTEQICEAFAKKDIRIQYIRQVENIGAQKNFQFVFDQARGEYFMWAADDDVRTSGFIEKNLDVLSNNPDYAFSSSSNCYEDEEELDEKLVSFTLEGAIYERISKFLENCWISHACFSSLIKRKLLLDFPDFSVSYLAFDWAIIIHLLMKGKFGRVQGEKLILSRNGTSASPGFVKSMRTKRVHYFVPFFEFSTKFISGVIENVELSRYQKIKLFLMIFKFNVTFIWNLNKGKAYTFLSPFKKCAFRILSSKVLRM